MTMRYFDHLQGLQYNCETRSAETIANIAITLIHQEDYMLRKLIDRLQDDFVKNGGIKERMYQARINYRNRSGGKKEE